eukprot:56807-Amphidinium_carterae.1
MLAPTCARTSVLPLVSPARLRWIRMDIMPSTAAMPSASPVTMPYVTRGVLWPSCKAGWHAAVEQYVPLEQ